MRAFNSGTLRLLLGPVTSVRDIVVGSATDDRITQLVMERGTVNMRTISVQDDSDDGSTVEFDIGFVNASGNIDLEYQTVTSDGATLFGAVTLTEFNCTGVLWAPQATAGANPGDVLFRGRSKGTSTGSGTSCAMAA